MYFDAAGAHLRRGSLFDRRVHAGHPALRQVHYRPRHTPGTTVSPRQIFGQLALIELFKPCILVHAGTDSCSTIRTRAEVS